MMPKKQGITQLFPACAGVILEVELEQLTEETFPRVCGGDPKAFFILIELLNFSPRVRG